MIKLWDNHYIVIDDSEIKEGDFCYWKAVKTTFEAVKDSLGRLPKKDDGSFKITHCSRPLSSKPHYASYGIITVSEAEQIMREHIDAISSKMIIRKEYLFTYENMLDAMGYAAAMDNTRPIQELKEECIQYIINHTKKTYNSRECKVKINERGKIELL